MEGRHFGKIIIEPRAIWFIEASNFVVVAMSKEAHFKKAKYGS